MGIDVGSARSRERELCECASRLKSAKNKLEQYQQIFGSCWQGQEIPYYIRAIENVKREIDNAASELRSIGSDIVDTAEEIWEEEEAERLRKEAEEAEREARKAAEKKKLTVSSGDRSM